YATALEFNRRALELNRSTGNRLGEAASLDSSGNIYRALGAYRLALQLFEQSLHMRKSLDDRPGAMETTHNIGLVHLSQGDYELAIAAFQQGIRLNRTWKLHDDWIVVEALRNIGAAASRLGGRDRADANFRASLAMAEREHDSWLQGELLDDLG